MCNTFVSNRRVVLAGASTLPHPEAIVVFEDMMYFTDATKMTVRRVNMYNNSNILTLATVTKTVSSYCIHTLVTITKTVKFID